MNVRLATTDRVKTVAYFHVILILWQWQNQYQYQPAPEICGGSAECWLILIAGRSETSVHLFIYLPSPPLLLMTDLILWHIEDSEKNIVCVSLQMFHSYVFIFSLMNCSALLLFKTWKKGWFILEALPSDRFFFSHSSLALGMYINTTFPTQVYDDATLTSSLSISIFCTWHCVQQMKCGLIWLWRSSY